MAALSVTDRYWAKVDVRGADECWPWLGYRHARGGYGRMTIGSHTDDSRGKILAHRLGYSLFHGGPVPPHLVVRHRCDNPPCQNPAHLELGTPADNIRDMYERGRATLGRAKLSNSDVLKIRELLREGCKAPDLADKFGVSQRSIYAIGAGETWGHLKESQC